MQTQRFKQFAYVAILETNVEATTVTSSDGSNHFLGKAITINRPWMVVVYYSWLAIIWRLYNPCCSSSRQVQTKSYLHAVQAYSSAHKACWKEYFQSSSKEDCLYFWWIMSWWYILCTKYFLYFHPKPWLNIAEIYFHFPHSTMRTLIQKIVIFHWFNLYSSCKERHWKI